VIGPSFAADQMPKSVARLIDVYLARRHDDERFVRHQSDRIGLEPFREGVHAQLIKGRTVVADTWRCCVTFASPTDVPAPDPCWCRSRCGARRARKLLARGDVGVWLAPDDAPEALPATWRGLPVIAIDFPQFSDGPVSTARLLRDATTTAANCVPSATSCATSCFYFGRSAFDAFLVRPDRACEEALQGLCGFRRKIQYAAHRRGRGDPRFRRRIDNCQEV